MAKQIFADIVNNLVGLTLKMTGAEINIINSDMIITVMLIRLSKKL